MREGGITLRGVVKDPQSKSVDGAQIRLFRMETGASVQTSSDREGRYVFERLAAGSFLLQVDKESFQSQTRNVELKGGGAVSEDVVLCCRRRQRFGRGDRRRRASKAR